MNSETLPENWEVVKLEEATEIIMGQSPKGDTYNTDGEGEPLINGPAEFGSEYPTPVQWTSKPTKLCKDGDILFCVRGNTTGRMNIADQRYCIGRGIAAIRERIQKSDTLFIRNLLEHERSSLYRIAIGGGSTFPNISTVHLKNYTISLPPLPEQRAIAHVLQTIQEAKAARQRELALERERKAALMDYLFSHGTKGEPHKQTEIGEIPESWEVVKLGDIVKESIKDGVHQTPTYVEDGVSFITAKDIVGNKISFAECAYISLEEHETLIKRVKPEIGDVLLTKVGTIGNVALVDVSQEFSIFVQVALIKPKSDIIDSGFLLYVLQSEKGQTEINRKSAQSTMRFIGVQKISTVCIPFPSLSEQAEIAEILQALDKKITALEQEIARLNELFHAMLDELMTGKRSAVPLIDSELPK